MDRYVDGCTAFHDVGGVDLDANRMAIQDGVTIRIVSLSYTDTYFARLYE
jgi:hypothetical protein